MGGERRGEKEGGVRGERINAGKRENEGGKERRGVGEIYPKPLICVAVSPNG